MFARRGGALLFMPFARFCFSSLCLAFFLFIVFYSLLSLALSFLSFVRCYFLSFAFLFPLFVGFFLCLDGFLLFHIYNNIINKISIISFVCAYVRTHAHAHDKDAVKYKAQKRAAFFCRPFACYPKIYLNIKAVSIFLPYVCRVW